MKRLWTGVGAGLIPILLTVGLIGCRQATADQEADPSEETEAAEGSQEASQPIQFPHDIHAGQFLMECQYCHFSAERSVDAGIPPVETCIGCHREGAVGGRLEAQQVEIAKVRAYHAAGEPIPWRRIYKVSDHVSFPHMRHVAAGLECQVCHGEVQEMGVLTEVAPVAGGLKMGWCVSCHVERGASRDCTVCHY